MKKIDKRSKEWKSMTKEEQEAYTSVLTTSNKSKGLGDSIAKITQATGVKSLVKKLFGPDCGCDERKLKLNKLFRYKTECLDEGEFNYLKDFFTRLKGTINPADQRKVLVIYNRVFNQRMVATSCAPCWIGIIDNVKKIYNEYEKEMGDN